MNAKYLLFRCLSLLYITVFIFRFYTPGQDKEKYKLQFREITCNVMVNTRPRIIVLRSRNDQPQLE